ncbi:MAG: DUF1761 domain-containing protein [Novosphingobium sp.]
MSSIAILSAAAAGALVLWLFWHGHMPWWAYPIQLIPAAMLGHALGRIGADTLAAKPWLYFMQSGGLALAFVLPALWMGQARRGGKLARSMRDSAAFLLAYLAMGLVFWAMG